MKSTVPLIKSDVAADATNTLRPLTHPLEQSKEGLSVNATPESEQWRPIPGFEGYLEVSDQGRVRSLDRMTYVSKSRGGNPYWRRHKGRILDQMTHPRGGYKYITLSGGGKVRPNAKVHHLVLEAFVGPRPSGMECCHANDTPDDNRLVNLRWGTREDNEADKAANGGSAQARCKSGEHEYTLENTIHLKNGARRCRACNRRDRAKVNERIRQRRRSDPAYAEECRRKELAAYHSRSGEINARRRDRRAAGRPA
ncbi:HNH endonuclease [Mycolicibacterium vanbaalenii]|uniref:NUMOD4 motif-containing HNH endonuclease n=1 Tax=Mycolicibacterium vanbaalenii TaxID=110539 RepID=UPI0035C75FFC|nr:HNH endonuclease [Mycolicibacterium vanbaalenii]